MPDGPEPSQRSFVHIHWIQAPNMMHTILPFVQFINSWEFSLKPLIVFFRLNSFIISFTKTFIRKITSCDILVISRMDYRHDLCK